MSSNSEEREEGEIVDDYEYIVSSDEEIVRQRIQELEEKNYELEKIAEISGIYSNGYDNALRRVSPAYMDYMHVPAYRRNAEIPEDISSISSVEFHTPIQRRKRSRNRDYRKTKVRKKTQHSHRNRQNERTRNYEQLKKLRTKIKSQIKTISLDSTQYSDVNRKELRFAIARNSNDRKATNRALKERLRTDNNFKSIAADNCQSKNDSSQNSAQTALLSKSPVNAEESTSLEEHELRLIALKSAVLNKHMARKRRDAEVAYSPTDFDDLLSNGVCSVDEDNIELNLADLTVGMDISPAASPDTNTDIEILEHSVNTRPVDMDIAQSDSEHEVLTQPTSADNWKCYEDIEYSAAMHYGIYMPEMQYQMLPIPPPPPPPMPAVTAETTTVANEVVVAAASPINQQSDIDDQDEEEQALRALLLAKIQSTKTKNNTNNTQTVESEPVASSTAEEQVEQTESTEQYANPTESILKQAVLRFRNKTDAACNMQESTISSVVKNTKENLAADESSVLTAAEPAVKPRINVRSVSTINADYDRQQALKSADTIIILSDDEQETSSSSFNDNALRDISYNLQNLHVNNQQKTSNTLTKKTNIPIAETQIKLSETQNKSNKNDAPNATLSSAATKPAAKSNKSNQVNKSLELKRKTAAATKNLSKKPKTINSANNNIAVSRCSTTKTTNIHTTTTTSTTTTASLKDVTTTTTTVSSAKATALTTTTTVSTAKATSSTKTATARKTSTPITTAALKTTTTATSNRSRLITVAPQVEVPKLVINLNTAESSSDEFDDIVINGDYTLDNSDLDLLQQDIASPISLPMNSPVSTPPQRCASPANTSTEQNNQVSTSKALVNDSFNKRLDEFLKNIRTCITHTNSTSTTTESIKTPNAKNSQNKPKESSATPMALKHLPVSAQEEYQRLMQRMKLLEQQKQKKIAHEQSKSAKTQLLDNATKTNTVTTTTTMANSSTAKTATTFVSANKKTLIKKVLVKNATNTTNGISSITDATAPTTTTKAFIERSKQEAKNIAKINTLNAYEKSYENLGDVIMSKLDKTLQQVEQVHQLKIQKIKSENLVHNLKIQLRDAQQQLTTAQTQMAEVFPNVKSTHQLICTLKRRRLKIGRAAHTLGKTLNGDDYRLKNDQKLDILKKMEKLAKAIVEVNRIKVTETARTAAATRECGTMTEGMTLEIVDINCNAHATNKEQQLIEHMELAYVDETPFSWKDYVSPLCQTSATSALKLNPNGILCPFSLTGECRDIACIYEHLK